MKNALHRQQATDIFRTVIHAIDPYEQIKEHVDFISSTYHRGNYQKLILISFGKAAYPMAKAITDLADDIVYRGIVITKYGHVLQAGLPDKIAVYEAAHPVPDIQSVLATEAVIRLLSEADRETLVVCLISGGGSALLVAPQEGITLEEKQEVTRLLLKAGADIRELNTVRKHLSRVKGGRLAALAQPSKVISLILSDVIGDPLDFIASGPTSPDGTTYENAMAVLDRYDLKERIPTKVIDILIRGIRGEIPETPKETNPIFDGVENIIIGNNKMALQIAETEAVKKGYRTTILSSSLQGEARDVGKWLAQKAIESYHTSVGQGTLCLVSGGETTVTVTGNGLGGRNMELALAFAEEIKGIEGITLLSAGTDGTDGPTDAAGAIVDGETILRAKNAGFLPEVYLKNNDSYHFLQATDDLLITGPTGTNVMDMQIIVMDVIK